LVELAKDGSKRTRWGAAGQQRVMDHFSLQRMVDRYREILLPTDSDRISVLPE